MAPAARDLDGGSAQRLNIRTMAGIAQSVRAPDCGSGGRRFDPGCSPHVTQILGPAAAPE